MRLFFAIDIPGPLKREMSVLQKKLGTGLSGVKWVEEENLHLTIKFLGEVPDNQLKGIVCAAHSKLDNCRPHTLNFTSIGFFPHRNRPRVIWLGISGETDVTREIARGLDEGLAPLGFEPDHKRKLHITLGRISRDTIGPDLVRRTQELNGIGAEKQFEVAEVRLYSSELTPSGPNYSVLEKFVFRY